jgi:pyruvate kinase
MNFSHGDYDYHQSVIDNTRKMVEGMHNSSHIGQIGQSVNVGLPADPNGRPVAIALDTVGYFRPSSLARPLI